MTRRRAALTRLLAVVVFAVSPKRRAHTRKPVAGAEPEREREGIRTLRLAERQARLQMLADALGPPPSNRAARRARDRAVRKAVGSSQDRENV